MIGRMPSIRCRSSFLSVSQTNTWPSSPLVTLAYRQEAFKVRTATHKNGIFGMPRGATDTSRVSLEGYDVRVVSKVDDLDIIVPVRGLERVLDA